MFEYLREVVVGAKSLLTGMAITAKYGFSKTVTVHYPYETIDITPNFRGHIELVMNPKNGKHKCISCMMCQRACPSGCINIHAEKPEGAKKKQLVSYHLDFTKCSLCANCTEACPTSALEFSNEYNLVGTSRHDFHFELVGRLNVKAEALGLGAKGEEPPAAPATPEPSAKPDAGETQSPDSGE